METPRSTGSTICDLASEKRRSMTGAAPTRGDPVVLAPPGPEPAALGRFGEFGGRFSPETLVPALDELEAAFRAAWASPAFRGEYAALLGGYAGRPTPLTECHRLSDRLGVRVLLKREDLTHTGSHKINNVLGQALLTREMGKDRMIAETGAGQHGVATATAAALFGFDCTIFMGAVDVRRQALNVFRMRLLGAEVIAVESGSATLKDAVNDAMREWVASVERTHYCLGSAMGPHPFPWMVRELQRVVGDEARRQCHALLGGRDPDLVVACVGGGSNAIGTFSPFVDSAVRLVGVEAGGLGLDTGRHGAAVNRGVPGVIHGMRSLFLQDEHGQLLEATSISAGLDYPGVGPEHAMLARTGRAEYPSATDEEAIAGLRLLAETEGIIAALEPAHALGWLAREAGRSVPAGSTVLVTLSGRGDKDAEQIAERLGALP
jgi:tryptophan synthase beta chain